ncbi:MAG: SH3 domain-containing protein [Aquificaceae bacterium]|nr:SH3 domain-containing protein [Aquificaceae bacterium]MDW8097028.1 SH3 domain-containing protein [Aquificaceae bacterium]
MAGWLLLLFGLGLSFALDVVGLSAQSYARIEHMKRVEHFPPVVEGAKVRSWITEDQPPKGELFIDGERLKESDLRKLREEANLEAIGEVVSVSYGWTLRRTNMRLYPSDATIHKGNPRIDYNQYTLVEPFTPLAVLHTSRSGKWLYVQAPYMRGWLKREDVYLASREKLLENLSLPFLVVAKGRVEVGGFVFGLGARIPYLEKKRDAYRLLLPDLSSLWVKRQEGLVEGYLPFSEDRARYILEELLGTPYDWGGKEGRWDCSSLVQSLFWVFGAELPRNSAQQARVGRVVATNFSSYEELRSLLEKLPPFRTLLFMRGHVMIYGGIEGGDVVVYHSVHRMTREDRTQWHINAVAKNYLERDRLRNLHRAIVSVNLLE